MTAMTREELLSLPASIDLVTAAQALGIGRTTAYQLVRAGEFPVKVLRLGARYRVVTSALLATLGIDATSPGTETGPRRRHQDQAPRTAPRPAFSPSHGPIAPFAGVVAEQPGRELIGRDGDVHALVPPAGGPPCG